MPFDYSGQDVGLVYPLEKERQLLELVETGDKAGAQVVLNEILGDVFFASSASQSVILTRVTELMVLLSRAAIKGGAIGLIIGADIPMFLGAMIIGPLGGIIIKKVDEFLDEKIPVGFEMVFNNFTLGIISFGLMMVSYAFIGPAILAANNVVKSA